MQQHTKVFLPLQQVIVPPHPHTPGILLALLLLCAVVVCSHPFFYFPVFYGMKGYVEGRSPTAIYEKYRAELWENCKALWTIWVPAQLVNFSVVPRHLRIPFGAFHKYNCRTHWLYMSNAWSGLCMPAVPVH